MQNHNFSLPNCHCQRDKTRFPPTSPNRTSNGGTATLAFFHRPRSKNWPRSSKESVVFFFIFFRKVAGRSPEEAASRGRKLNAEGTAEGGCEGRGEVHRKEARKEFVGREIRPRKNAGGRPGSPPGSHTQKRRKKPPEEGRKTVRRTRWKGDGRRTEANAGNAKRRVEARRKPPRRHPRKAAGRSDRRRPEPHRKANRRKPGRKDARSTSRSPERSPEGGQERRPEGGPLEASRKPSGRRLEGCRKVAGGPLEDCRRGSEGRPGWLQEPRPEQGERPPGRRRKDRQDRQGF